RLLDRLVAVEHRRHPPKVDPVRPHRNAAEDHPAVRGVVGDRVDDRAPLQLDVGVQDLERRRDVLGRAQHVEERAVRSFERLLEDEGQLDLDPYVGEVVERDDRAVLPHRVVEHHPVVGLGDAGRLLHGLGGEPDLPADETASRSDPRVPPHALDRVGVLDRGLRVARRDAGDDALGPIGLGELVRDLRDRVGVQHDLILSLPFALVSGQS
ncbi:hypothetical protein ABE10_10495, partial [Bacillus toyonensis]|nr:hypothetical protein [Bacillus toyonensis]